MCKQYDSITAVSDAAIQLSRVCGERAAQSARTEREITGDIFRRAVPKALVAPEDMQEMLRNIP